MTSFFRTLQIFRKGIAYVIQEQRDLQEMAYIRREFELNQDIDGDNDMGNHQVTEHREIENGFWSLVDGGETFKNTQTLHNALLDEDSSITSMTITSSHMLFVDVSGPNDMNISFTLPVHHPERAVIQKGRLETTPIESLREIVRITSEKTPYYGRILSGVWKEQFDHDDKLKDITRI